MGRADASRVRSSRFDLPSVCPSPPRRRGRAGSRGGSTIPRTPRHSRPRRRATARLGPGALLPAAPGRLGGVGEAAPRTTGDRRWARETRPGAAVYPGACAIREMPHSRQRTRPAAAASANHAAGRAGACGALPRLRGLPSLDAAERGQHELRGGRARARCTGGRLRLQRIRRHDATVAGRDGRVRGRAMTYGREHTVPSHSAAVNTSYPSQLELPHFEYGLNNPVPSQVRLRKRNFSLITSDTNSSSSAPYDRYVSSGATRSMTRR